MELRVSVQDRSKLQAIFNRQVVLADKRAITEPAITRGKWALEMEKENHRAGSLQMLRERKENRVKGNASDFPDHRERVRPWPRDSHRSQKSRQNPLKT
jgi:hypothetical protein